MDVIEQALIAKSRISKRIKPIADALETDNQGSETAFIEIGERVQTVYQQACQLENDSQAAMNIIAGQAENGVLTDVNSLTSSCISGLHSWQAQISDKLDSISDIASRLGNLAPNSIELKKIAKRLRTINIYFAVESSRYPESSAAFEAYTSELEKLVDYIQQVTQDIEHDSIDAQCKQMKACDSVALGVKELNAMAEIAEMAMQEASSEIDEIARFTTSAMERTKQLSNDVAVQIGNMVLSLQFRDITRQQIEHVVEALREAETLVAEGDLPSISRAYRMLSIQLAQMRHVSRTLSSAHSSVEQSFNSIQSKATELLSDIAVVDEGQMQSSELSAALSRLSEALATIQALLINAQNLAQETGSAANMASEATLLLSNRAERVEDVNMDINIQALNAVITSIRLKEKGRTLAILAQEVTGLSQRCNGFVTEVAGILEEINSLATEVVGDSHSSDDGTGIITRLDEMINRVAEACVGYETYSIKMVKEARDIREMVDQAGQMLRIIPELAEKMQSQIEVLEGITVELRSALPEDFEENEPDLSEQLSKYTMQSERDTHNKVMNSDTTERSGDEGIELFDSSDDLGDNIELF